MYMRNIKIKLWQSLYCQIMFTSVLMLVKLFIVLEPVHAASVLTAAWNLGSVNGKSNNGL